MRRVTAQMAAFAVFYVDQQGTAVGTIQRADGVSHFRHVLIIAARGYSVACAAKSFILEEMMPHGNLRHAGYVTFVKRLVPKRVFLRPDFTIRRPFLALQSTLAV